MEEHPWKMFAKLKKKVAEEAASAPRPGGTARLPRSVSRESITSVGADSGDDFPSDGSSSREDLSSQLFRRNQQIRKLEVKLSDYAEQVRNLQKIKEKLEIALEKHQDSSMRKLQEQNEAHQANRAKMAEGMALALEKKDQEWREKLAHLENLLQKEENLKYLELKLEVTTRELTHTREELQTSSALSSRLAGELQELRQQHEELESERDELIEAEESAESKITTLEQRGHDLQAFIQRLSVDLQNAQASTSGCEKRLATLQAEHESLKLEYEQHKQKAQPAMVAAEEKNQLISRLQEKVSLLEKRLEGDLSDDEHVRELLKEKSVLEQRLEESRQQLLATRASHTKSLSLLETQIHTLNCQVAEGQALLNTKEEFARSLQESSLQQQKEHERALQLASEAVAKSKDDVRERELQVQKLQRDLEAESSRVQEAISAAERQRAELVGRQEEQVAALRAAHQSEVATVRHRVSQLENENEELKERCRDLESSLKKQEPEVERLQAEMDRRETVGVEMARALEEAQTQREELQQQVADLTLLLKEKDQLLADKTAALLKGEEELQRLRQGHDALLLQIRQLQSDLELCRRQTVEREAAAGEQMSLSDSAPLGKHLRPSEDGEAEPNGEVSAMDVLQLQKDNRDLEQQVAEKNKVIKQLQQRITELKKTLQKELKIRPDGEVPEVPSAALTVTNNSDLNDSREINFEYLKHVVLKFMSCRESEAFHLIKAVSVLLNFSPEEESMLKETLEYKTSWFGSKPSPRGSIRPSISNPRTPWL
ncbi:golgin subfamily A member 1 isoform X2 [Tiliqua scincoides]|uniref:golgin subfamily A member 1 isoform X2 n=1 Tax=Tiliqua scincoides TaxID=71010 RepID=UPI00346238D6